MADEDLVLKLPERPKKDPPDVLRANLRSTVAITISIASLLLAGLNWWDARQSRKFAQGPYIEIIKAAFDNESSLVMTLRNIGKTPAINPEVTSDVYVSSMPELGVFEKLTGWVGAAGMLFGPNIPTATEATMAAYIPDENTLNKLIRNPRQKILELRGRIGYRDNDGNDFRTPFCYQIHLSDKQVPDASTCWSEGPFQYIRKFHR